MYWTAPAKARADRQIANRTRDDAPRSWIGTGMRGSPSVRVGIQRGDTSEPTVNDLCTASAILAAM